MAELAGAGHEVWNLDVVRPSESHPGRYIQVDLADAGEVYDAFAQAKPEGVCHLAANPSPGGYPRQQTFANNVMSTYHVMQAAGDLGVKRLVYAGSEMATGWLTTDELPPVFPFTEEHRVPSPNGYAMSKYIGEVIADGMVRRYPMTIVTLRINNIILPEQYPSFPDRQKAYPGGSPNFWSYIDARDVASAFRAALEGESPGHEVFLIAAADTWLDVPTRTAMKDRYGLDLDLPASRGEFQSMFDCGKMERFFGWRPAHSWREALGRADG